MPFSVEATLKPSALVGRGGVRPVAVDTSRKNTVDTVETVPEQPQPQAETARSRDRPGSLGPVAKVDLVA